jgi:hypothetical protein
MTRRMLECGVSDMASKVAERSHMNCPQHRKPSRLSEVHERSRLQSSAHAQPEIIVPAAFAYVHLMNASRCARNALVLPLLWLQAAALLRCHELLLHQARWPRHRLHDPLDPQYVCRQHWALQADCRLLTSCGPRVPPR